jgi:hypothetical protein
MHRHIMRGVLTAAAMLLCAGSAAAWHVDGTILCDGTGIPISGVQVCVESTDGMGFSSCTTSDQDGQYFIALPEEPGCYRVSVTLGQNEVAVTPASGSFDFCTTTSDFEITSDFVIASPSCTAGRCWLTGGGAKFSTITNTDLGQVTKKNKVWNWGGNVNPGCNTDAGQGGQWNTIADDQKLHFHGVAMHVVRCGNVDGIPPGSTSPKTPFNFIEWEGTGTLKGIKGNKVDYGTVYFWARAEDRNEPGSNGQRDGAGKDRYFLNVFTNQSDPVGTSVMLVDMDGNPATVDPIIITDVNMQIHVSSCDGPDFVTLTAAAPPSAIMAPSTDAPAALWFAAPSPSPARGGNALLRYSVPKSADVSLTVYDVSGRAVRTLANGRVGAGAHNVPWDLRDTGGSPVEGGMYFMRLRVDGQVLTQRLAVVR